MPNSIQMLFTLFVKGHKVNQSAGWYHQGKGSYQMHFSLQLNCLMDTAEGLPFNLVSFCLLLCFPWHYFSFSRLVIQALKSLFSSVCKSLASTACRNATLVTESRSIRAASASMKMWRVRARSPGFNTFLLHIYQQLLASLGWWKSLPKES